MKVFTGQLTIKPEYDLRSICPLEEMLLFDIETTGLKKETTQLYLIGCVWFRDNTWHIRQYLTENAGDEYHILDAFLEFASGFKTLVHFNGDSFDIPYIQYKRDYYGMETDLKNFGSFDIYKAVRCARRFLGMSSMSQKSLEEFLGIYREDLYSGGLLIPVYYDYELTGSADKEKILLLHNYDDLQGMLKILPILAYGDMMKGGFVLERIGETKETAVINLRLSSEVPVKCEYQFSLTPKGKGWALTESKGASCPGRHSDADISILADRDLLQIGLRIREGTGIVPLENISDYYYLPEEDKVIHKDVAQFLDRSRRVKATRKNCVLRKQGRFIVQPCARFSPAYFMGEDRKILFADWDALKENMQKGDLAYPETLKGLAQDILDLVSSL